jgi:RimJ/RimL family protein N-acetyltransferase
MNIQIQPMSESDLPKLIEWAEDERTLIQWCGPVFEFPLTIKQLKDYYAPTLKPDPLRYIFKAVNETGVMTGMTEIGSVDRRNLLASLCRIYVDKNYRGRGVADQLIKTALRFGFEKLDMVRMELRVYTFNSGAIKTYERLGFRREGLMRKVTKYNNEFWDGFVYAILKEEWDELNRTQKSS